MRNDAIAYNEKYWNNHADLWFGTRYVSIDEIDWVQEYNRRSVYNCNRCVFSKDGDLSVVDKISKENPQVLDIPKTRLSWGGKEFLPK